MWLRRIFPTAAAASGLKYPSKVSQGTYMKYWGSPGFWQIWPSGLGLTGTLFTEKENETEKVKCKKVMTLSLTMMIMLIIMVLMTSMMTMMTMVSTIWSGEKKIKPILQMPVTVKAESEQRTYPSTPRMANMALFRWWWWRGWWWWWWRWWSWWWWY